jgi:DNA-binding MarR family transcriptional regulator
MVVEPHAIYRAVQAGFLEVRQLALLMAVTREPGLSVRDYAPRIGVSKSATSRACNALLDAELIEGQKTPRDNRLRTLRPTARGIQIITEIVGPECLHANPQPDRPSAAH